MDMATESCGISRADTSLSTTVETPALFANGSRLPRLGRQGTAHGRRRCSAHSSPTGGQTKWRCCVSRLGS